MPNQPKAIVVYCTASSVEEARKLTEILVRDKLAACVSMIPKVHSTYWWKGQIERAEETLLLIKTQPAKFKALMKRIKQSHSYTVPEILAVPVLDGNPDYLKWLKESTSS
jgi:periplasmic divalent cation tolerance protein